MDNPHPTHPQGLIANSVRHHDHYHNPHLRVNTTLEGGNEPSPPHHPIPKGCCISPTPNPHAHPSDGVGGGGEGVVRELKPLSNSKSVHPSIQNPEFRVQVVNNPYLITPPLFGYLGRARNRPDQILMVLE